MHHNRQKNIYTRENFTCLPIYLSIYPTIYNFITIILRRRSRRIMIITRWALFTSKQVSKSEHYYYDTVPNGHYCKKKKEILLNEIGLYQKITNILSRIGCWRRKRRRRRRRRPNIFLYDRFVVLMIHLCNDRIKNDVHYHPIVMTTKQAMKKPVLPFYLVRWLGRFWTRSLKWRGKFVKRVSSFFVSLLN